MTLTLPRQGDRLRISVPVLLFGATILAQVAYPLTPDAGRGRLTVAIVVLAAAAALGHAVAGFGRRGLGAIALVAAIGFTAEIVGVHTGVPFGHYAYAGTLGPQVAGVPVVVAAAWVMMAWPAAVVARRLTSSRPARVVVGGWALAAWDVFLDPQMVSAGHWRWAAGARHLPGVPDVPLSNFGGWLLVALIVSAVVQAMLPPLPPLPVAEGGDGAVIAFYLWTFASSVLAMAAFWHRPPVAAWGALAMGIVALPLALAVRRR